MSFRYRHGDRPLEGYTIQRGVGRGAFGEVYYAVSDGGREVALKTIFQNHEVELRGVQHCINLKSPHLVAIFDVRYADDSTPVVIMEYVAGPSLRELLREHPQGLGSQRTAYLLGEITKGLAYLHERGIVHRDLKPENLFYEDGYVKIGDYGLSKYVSVSRQSGQTISVGTVHYMAPEIGSGIYNQGIDIYALGVILHELLTGTVPFKGDSFGEILMKHLTVEPELDGIEEPFRSVISRALRKKAEERYATVEEMARDVFRDEAVTRSVHLFQPESLSVAARRLAPVVAEHAGSAGEGAAPAPPALDVPAAAPRVPPSPRVPPPETPGAEERRPPHAAARSEVEKNGAAPVAGTTDARHRGAPVSPPASERGEDPLDASQRLARAAFVLLAAAAAVAVLGIGRHPILSAAGFLLVAGSGAWALVASETSLARRFRLGEGLPRRMAAAVLAFFPAAIGASLLSPGRSVFTAPIAFSAGLLAANWQKRMDPWRPQRLSVGDGFLVGLLAFVVCLILGAPPGVAVATATAMATASLVVNAYSPWLPPESRREARRRAQEVAASPAASEPFPPGPAPSGGWDRVVGASIPTPDDPPQPPGVLARFFWLFLAAAFAALGLSCLAVPLAISVRHPEEKLLFGGFFLGSMGYLGFCLYRGLWARSPSMWGRTIRPFILVTLGNAIAISAYFLFMGPAYGAWRFGTDETVVTLVFGLVALVLLALVLGFERLVRFDEPQLVHARHLPRPERPVHPLMRLFELLLAATAFTGSLGFGAVGLLAVRLSEWDRAGMLSSALGLFALGIFFARQALRYRQGHLWEGTVRPFIITASAVAVSIVTLLLAWRPASTYRHWRQGRQGYLEIQEVYRRGFGEEETAVCLVVGIVALVFGVFALLVRGPGREIAGSRLFAWRLPPASGDPGPRVHGGWLGLGTMCWLLAMLGGLAAVAARTGLARSLAGGLELEGEALRRLGDLLGSLGPTLFMALAGSACVTLARARSGAVHLARGIVGQAALLLALLAVLRVGAMVQVMPASPKPVFDIGAPIGQLTFLLNGIFALGVLALLLLAWPLGGRRARGAAGGLRS